jgi:formamidopyrimidine-DNA glycosylase
MARDSLFHRTDLICDACGCVPRKPAINLRLNVYCATCAREVGMDAAEHGTAHS